MVNCRWWGTSCLRSRGNLSPAEWLVGTIRTINVANSDVHDDFFSFYFYNYYYFLLFFNFFFVEKKNWKICVRNRKSENPTKENLSGPDLLAPKQLTRMRALTTFIIIKHFLLNGSNNSIFASTDNLLTFPQQI